MIDQNKSKLILGFSLIAVAFLFILVALFFIGKKAQSPAVKPQLEVQLANLIAEKAEKQLSAADAEHVKHKPFNLGDFLKHAESIYGPDELNRKEGVLWIDRKSSVFLVTLGAVNGVKAGSLLSVYEDDNKVGTLTVDVSLDIVSYAKPAGKTAADFDKNYYRVVLAGTP